MTYEMYALQEGMKELENIIKAFQYLMHREVMHEVDINSFNAEIKDEHGTALTEYFEVYYNKSELSIQFLDTLLEISPECIKCLNIEYDRDEHYDFNNLIFEVKHPNEIVNAETFFQASTITDLSKLDGHEWFVVVMKAFAEIADFFEDDSEDVY